MIIVEYDLNDNFIDLYESYVSLAYNFKTSVKSIQCIVSRLNRGKISKVYDCSIAKWVILYKYNLSELEKIEE